MMQSRRFIVTVQGRLGARFADAFPGARVDPGHGYTRLITEPFDQGQLHGLLNRVRDFSLDLLAVEAIPNASPGRGATPRESATVGRPHG
jgi:hypothetical protein